MSKLLFWSPYHGLGQTSNLHVTSTILSILHKKSVLLMQTHYKYNNLESPLVGCGIDKGSENNELFQGIGLDMAVTYSNMSKLNKKNLESCCLTFPPTSLLLLPGSEVRNKETFDRDIGRSVNYLIRDTDKLVDFVMIDANSGNDELSMKLMDLADLLVVNLTQRRYVVEKFFQEYGEYFRSKSNVFYLFGDYDDNSSYNINNFRRKYHRYINAANSGVIPYCTKYMDVQNESDVLRFMAKGLQSGNKQRLQRLLFQLPRGVWKDRYEQEETDYFFHRARLSTEKICELLKVTGKKVLKEGKRA